MTTYEAMLIIDLVKITKIKGGNIEEKINAHFSNSPDYVHPLGIKEIS